jgi:hypothetical protein
VWSEAAHDARMSNFLKRLIRYRTTSIITCPENLRHAAVRQGMGGGLRDCSRWPEKAFCDQDCLRQIEANPEACRLHTIVASWYAGKTCARCARFIAPIVWHDRPPALLGSDGSTREWKEVAPEELPQLFATHAPICWSCHNIAAFQREFPGVAFERPGASPIIATND